MWTDDGRTTEAYHAINSPGAFGSGELKLNDLLIGLLKGKVCLYGTLLFTWLSLVMSMMVFFCAVFFPRRCLG